VKSLHCFLKKLSKAPHHSTIHTIPRDLLSLGVDVNAVIHEGNFLSETNGATPLHASIIQTNFYVKDDMDAMMDIARLLIQHGANVNATSNGILSPLYMAFDYHAGNELCSLLINNGALLQTDQS